MICSLAAFVIIFFRDIFIALIICLYDEGMENVSLVLWDTVMCIFETGRGGHSRCQAQV